MGLVVLVTNFNNERYIKRCLDSLLQQEYEEWQCWFMDDMSKDGSVEIARNMIDERFRLIINESKLYQLGNYENTINKLDKYDVCVTLDGDDWLPDRSVLDRIVEEYKDDDLWLTWGSMMSISGKRNINPTLDDVFIHRFVPCHLRTWRAFLWKMIPRENLRDISGNYFRCGGDVAFMTAMTRIAGRARCKFLESMNYCYNDVNPICNHVIRAKEQEFNNRQILTLAEEQAMNDGKLKIF